MLCPDCGREVGLLMRLCSKCRAKKRDEMTMLLRANEGHVTTEKTEKVEKILSSKIFHYLENPYIACNVCLGAFWVLVISLLLWGNETFFQAVCHSTFVVGIFVGVLTHVYFILQLTNSGTSLRRVTSSLLPIATLTSKTDQNGKLRTIVMFNTGGYLSASASFLLTLVNM